MVLICYIKSFLWIIPFGQNKKKEKGYTVQKLHVVLLKGNVGVLSGSVSEC